VCVVFPGEAYAAVQLDSLRGYIGIRLASGEGGDGREFAAFSVAVSAA
jgi:hypothetical protein